MLKKTILSIMISTYCCLSLTMQNSEFSAHLSQNFHKIPCLTGIFLIGASTYILYKQTNSTIPGLNISLNAAIKCPVNAHAFSNITFPAPVALNTVDRFIDRSAAIIFCFLGVMCIKYSYNK